MGRKNIRDQTGVGRRSGRTGCPGCGDGLHILLLGRIGLMKISYDSEVDALYIRLVDEPVQVITQRLSEDVAVNYAPDGSIVGIEILDASVHVFRPGTE